MNIESRQHEAITIVSLNGRLDAKTNAEVDQYLTACIDEGNHQLLLDLSGLTYVSSVGLRVFLSTGKKLKGLKGKMVFSSMQEGVHEVFEITGFLDIFTVADDEESAVSQF